ncbi:hypothetical protein N7454_001274 [Penicillium verhagenii]|nr:hypothetical protein N7454_001274 [Penicillium verhagenii]
MPICPALNFLFHLCSLSRSCFMIEVKAVPFSPSLNFDDSKELVALLGRRRRGVTFLIAETSPLARHRTSYPTTTDFNSPHPIEPLGLSFSGKLQKPNPRMDNCGTLNGLLVY